MTTPVLPHLKRATTRLLGYLAVSAVAAFALPGRQPWMLRTVFGWSVGATVAVLWSFFRVFSSNARTTRERAAASDPGRTAVWLVVLLSAGLSLVASLTIMSDRRIAEPAWQPYLLGLGMWAVVSAWLLTHISFTLRYSHLYYRDEGGVGGLDFPGGEPPDDWDFAYFAFTLGMCFQTSDIAVTERSIRRTALMHSILSYFYNTVIVALILNLIFGILSPDS